MTTKTETKVRDMRASATIVDEAPASAQPLVLGNEPNREQVILHVLARAAKDPTLNLDRIEKLLDIQRQITAIKAESEFIAAMALFKSNVGKITKGKRVYYQTDKGPVDYWHATIGAVCEAIVPALAAVGISHRWDLEQAQGGRISVTCVLTHTGGHSTKTTLSAAPDESGRKNSIQAVSSTVSYLERYTLLAGTGMATHDQEDNDGRGAPDDDEPQALTDEQVANIEALISETNASRAKLCNIFGVELVSDIPPDRYGEAIAKLEARRKS